MSLRLDSPSQFKRRPALAKVAVEFRLPTTRGALERLARGVERLVALDAPWIVVVDGLIRVAWLEGGRQRVLDVLTPRLEERCREFADDPDLVLK